MEKYSFFNAELVNGEYDRTYLAEDYARYFASFIGNGVYPNPANNLQVTSNNTDMKITVGSGKAWINGYFYDNNSSIIFTLDNADGVLNRIDSVVVRLDLVNRNIKATIKKGTFAINPQAPELTRNDDVFEIQLATVYVGAGVIKIIQANVTDTRQDISLCGVVSGVVDQIDTTGLFAQYNNAFSNWFETIKNQLGQDIAGNLLDNIEAHKSNTSLHVTSEDKNSWNSKADGATVTSHTGNTTIHVTASDKTNWNNKAAGSHVSDTVLHTTQAEKNKWNGTANTWVATSVTNAIGQNHYDLTIPNFVYTDNCQVTFRTTTVSAAVNFLRVNSGEWFDIVTTAKERDITGAWSEGVSVTLTLSSVSVLGTYKTAFFKAGGASTPKFPTYTGSHAIFGTEEKGYMELYSSGTLTAQANMTVEAFLVGGGASGVTRQSTSSGTDYAGGGGGGGHVKLLSNLALISKQTYPVTIGAGGNSQKADLSSVCIAGGTTAAFGNTALGGTASNTPFYNGSNGGSGGGAGSSSSSGTGGAGGANGSNGSPSPTGGSSSAGSGAGISTSFNGKYYAGGGGGGGSTGGGASGGGGAGGSNLENGKNATANTGGGGGGAGSNTHQPARLRVGGDGGSGIIIIRWGY